MDIDARKQEWEHRAYEGYEKGPVPGAFHARVVICTPSYYGVTSDVRSLQGASDPMLDTFRVVA